MSEPTVDLSTADGPAIDASMESPAPASGETRATPPGWDKPGAILLIIGVFALITVAGVVIANRTDVDKNPDAAEMDDVAVYAYFGGMHSNDPITYAENPPVGGEHADIWQNCGFYDGAVSSEQAVHSLEHGAVWITYSPDLAEEQRVRLQELTREHDYVLISAFTGLPSPIVATAWNHQLVLDDLDDDQLNEFIRRFKLNDESPEPGAPCTGGSSEMAA